MWAAFNRGWNPLATRTSELRDCYAAALKASARNVSAPLGQHVCIRNVVCTWSCWQYAVRWCTLICLLTVLLAMIVVYPALWSSPQSTFWSDSDMRVWLSWSVASAFSRLVLSAAELHTLLNGQFLLSPGLYSRVKVCGNVSFQSSF